ncbi:hypothetical protein K8T06_08505 [bacterium]|nr:hypothetical protein [bacterium]
MFTIDVCLPVVYFIYMKLAPRTVILPTVIFFLLRLASALFSSSSAAIFEEQYTGVMAHLLFSDFEMPWYMLSMGPQEIIGRTILALMCAGSFSLFGDNLIALKLPVLLFSTFSFLFWHLLLIRMTSRFGLWTSAVLWFFPPPLIQSMCILSFGNHWENTLNFALVLFFACLWNEHPKRISWFFLACLTTGFSLIFCASALPLVMAITVTFLFFNRNRLSVGNAFKGVLCFIVPLIPYCLLIYLRTGKMFSLYNISSSTAESVISINSIVHRFLEFFLTHLPLSATKTVCIFIESPGISSYQYWAAISFLMLCLYAVVNLLMQKEIRWIAFVSALFFIFFMCLWSFSGHKITPDNGYLTYRYYSILYPFFFLLIGLMSGQTRSLLKQIIIGVIIIIILIPNIRFFQKNLRITDFHLGRSASAINWITISEWVYYSHISPTDCFRSPDERLHILEKLSRVTSSLQQKQIGLGMGGHEAIQAPPDVNIMDFLEKSLVLPSRMQHAWPSVRVGFCMVLPMLKTYSNDELALKISNEPEDFRSDYYRALGIGIALSNKRFGHRKFVQWDLIPAKSRIDVAFGYGFGSQIAIWGVNLDEYQILIPEIFTEEEKKSFAHGFGSSLGWFFPLHGEKMLKIKTSQFSDDLYPVIEWAYYATIKKLNLRGL